MPRLTKLFALIRIMLIFKTLSEEYHRNSLENCKTDAVGNKQHNDKTLTPAAKLNASWWPSMVGHIWSNALPLVGTCVMNCPTRRSFMFLLSTDE